MNNQNRSLQILNMLPHYLMVGALTEETVPTAQTIVHSDIVKRDCSHESLKAVARAAELVNQQVIGLSSCYTSILGVLRPFLVNQGNRGEKTYVKVKRWF